MDAPLVQYVRTSDGCDIAYCSSGSGPPLVYIPSQLMDLRVAWDLYPDWLEGLAQRFRFVQYDCRGQGFSSRNLPSDLTVSNFILDLEAVVDRLELDRFFIWGWGNRSHIAVRYALAHPERVLGLVLDICFVSNSIIGRRALFRAVPTEDWDTFLHLVAGRGASPDEHDERVSLMRRTMTAEDWLAQGLACQDSDLTEELPRLKVPTLVMHPRDYPRFPADESMKFAALIPGARFQLLDGADIYGNAAQGLSAIDAFLGDLPAAVQPPPQDDVLSSREVEVLRLLAAGKSNQQIADELVISLNTVRRHVSNILGKTEAANRTEAAVYARDHGLT